MLKFAVLALCAALAYTQEKDGAGQGSNLIEESPKQLIADNFKQGFSKRPAGMASITRMPPKMRNLLQGPDIQNPGFLEAIGTALQDAWDGFMRSLSQPNKKAGHHGMAGAPGSAGNVTADGGMGGSNEVGNNRADGGAHGGPSSRLAQDQQQSAPSGTMDGPANMADSAANITGTSEDTAGKGGGTLRDAWEKAGNSLASAAGDLGDEIKGGANNTLNTIREGVGSLLGTINSGVKDAEDAVNPGNRRA